MNRAIFVKTTKDSLPVGLLTGIGTIGFVVLFVFAMVNMGKEVLQFIGQFPFLKNIFEMSLGISVSGDISMDVLLAVCFTHGVVLILGWSLVISTVTRVSVGEVERGTADLLLSLPVSRLSVTASTTAVWVIFAGILAICPLIGVWIGSIICTEGDEVRMVKFLPAVVNLFALHLAVGGLCTLVSAITNRRGTAITIVVAVALVSVTLNFVEPFISLIKQIRFIGLLHYFRPVDIVRIGAWPWKEILALSGFGIACWVVGAVIFCRKDIPVA